MNFQLKLTEDKQKLAEAIEKRPPLYDPYRNSRRYDSVRSKLWEEVAMEIVWKSVSDDKRSEIVNEVKKKWNSMRTIHNKAKKNTGRISDGYLPFLDQASSSASTSALPPNPEWLIPDITLSNEVTDASEQSLGPSTSNENLLQRVQRLEEIMNALRRDMDVIKTNLQNTN